jgi:hypothetical protein
MARLRVLKRERHHADGVIRRGYASPKGWDLEGLGGAAFKYLSRTETIGEFCPSMPSEKTVGGPE